MPNLKVMLNGMRNQIPNDASTFRNFSFLSSNKNKNKSNISSPIHFSNSRGLVMAGYTSVYVFVSIKMASCHPLLIIIFSPCSFFIHNIRIYHSVRAHKRRRKFSRKVSKNYGFVCATTFSNKRVT